MNGRPSTSWPRSARRTCDDRLVGGPSGAGGRRRRRDRRAGGLGATITGDLAANGVRVAVLDIDGAACERLTAELGDGGVVRRGDVRDPEDLEALFAAADERWGRLDILVNVPGAPNGGRTASSDHAEPRRDHR